MTEQGNYGPNITSIDNTGNVFVATNLVNNQAPSAFSVIDPKNIIFTPRLGSSQPQAWFQPHITRSLANIVFQQHLLVVQIQPGVQGRQFLREIALFLQNILPVDVVEHDGLSADTSQIVDDVPAVLRNELQKHSAPTVLLLPDARRYLLGGNLSLVRDIAASNGHFVLAGTIEHSEMWYLKPHEKYYWKELPHHEQLFRSAYLSAYLSEQLIERQASLPRSLLYSTNPADDLLSDQATVATVAERLKSPINIDSWVQAVTSLPRDASMKDAYDRISIFGSADLYFLVEHWYRHVLDEYERLFAIIVSLLDGLEETQILSALQKLKDERAIFHGFRAGIIDRSHIRPLSRFFDFAKVDAQPTRIRSRVSGQRKVMLEIALDDHHMNMRQIIPWLVALIRASDDRDARHSLLYSTPESRSQLRQTVGTSLSYLCELASSMVTPELPMLLVDLYPDQGPVYLARIFAQRAAIDSSKKVEALLATWQQNTDIHRKITQEYTTEYKKTIDPRDAINSLVVLTASYIWAEAPMDEVLPLQKLLDSAVVELGTRTEFAFKKYLLQLLPVNPHPFITAARACIIQNRLHAEIKEKVVKAYGTKPQETLLLLDAWVHASVEQVTLPEQRANTETCLCFVMQVLSELVTSYSAAACPPQFYQYVYTTLDTISSPSARAKVWQAGFVVSQSNPDACKELIRHVELADVTDLKGHAPGKGIFQQQMVSFFRDHLQSVWITTKTLPPGIQPALLQLTLDSREPMHRCIAEILTGWAAIEPTFDPVATLLTWRSDVQVQQPLHIMFPEQHPSAPDDESQTLIDSVLVLLVCYHLQIPKLQQRPELRHLLEWTAYITNARVRRYMRQNILSTSPTYMDDLAPALHVLIQEHSDEAEVMAWLVKAACNKPTAVLRLLDTWVNNTHGTLGNNSFNSSHNQAEAFLEIIARVLAMVADVSDTTRYLPSIQQQLCGLLGMVENPVIRATIVDKSIAVLGNDAQLLFAFLRMIRTSDAAFVQSQLLHLFQTQYKAKHRLMPLWGVKEPYDRVVRQFLDGATVVEQALLLVLDSINNPEDFLGMFAFTCLCDVAQSVSTTPFRRPRTSINQLTSWYHRYFRDPLIPVLVTYKKPQLVQKMVNNLLPVMWKFRQTHADAFPLVFARLRSMDNDLWREVAGCLEEAIELHEAPPWLPLLRQPRFWSALSMLPLSRSSARK